MSSGNSATEKGPGTVELDEIFHVTDNPLASSRELDDDQPPSGRESRSKTVTTRRRMGRSSTVSVADTSAIKISLPWMILSLLVITFNCYLALLATELLPITFLVNFIRGDCADCTEETQKAEARLMIRHTCGAMISMIQLIIGFVFFHNPYKPITAPLQLTALVLGIASRALLAVVPAGIDASSHRAYSYGFMYVVDAPLLLIMYFVAYKRCQTIKSNFTPDQASQLVFGTLPKVVFSAVTTFLFLIGESMSCLVSKARDDLPDSMSQCDDVVYSNVTLMTWSAVFAFVQLAIFPFMTSNYTKANLVRFDFAFREQAQLIFGGVSLSLSIFVFASSQDGGYDTDNGTLTSESARDSLNWTCKFAIYVFVVSALLFHERKSSTATTTSSTLKRVTEYLRGLMRTRSRVAFAPLVRGVLIISSVAFLIPGIATVVMTRSEAEYTRIDAAKKASSLTSYGWMMSLGFAMFFTYSTPKGKQTAEDGFYVGIAVTNAAFAIAGHALLGDFTKHSLNITLIVILSASVQPLIRVTRTYIAMHSDAHVEEHLIKSAAAIGGLLGPAIFLFAETSSCYTSEDDFQVACGRLLESNFAVSFHLMCSAAVYLGQGIVYRHLSMDEILSLRNVDAGFVVKGLLQSLAWAMAMIMFGNRPRDAPDEGESEAILTEIAVAMKYMVVLIWLILCVWEHFHTKHKVHRDHVLSGEREEGEGGGGWLAQRWKRVWGGLSEFVKSKAVNGKEARVSHLYSWVALAGAWLLSVVPAVVALAVVGVQGKDSNIANLFYWLNMSVEFTAAVLYVTYMLLDLEPDRKVAGINTYVMAVAACIRVPVVFALTGEVGIVDVALTLLWGFFSRFMSSVRSKASAHPVEEERREHAGTVFNVAVRVLAPLIVMGSEMAWCWLKTYLESEGEGVLMNEHITCRGITYGCEGLTTLIVFTGLMPLLTVHAKMTLTLENMCKFKLSAIEAIQVGALGVYCVYAMGYYATRQERNVSGAEGAIQFGLIVVLLSSVIGGTVLKKGEESEEGEDVAGRERSSTASGSRQSVTDRISFGAEKSMWEGGMKGATGMGRIKRASTRGIERETESRDASIVEEEDEAAFNPGMI